VDAILDLGQDGNRDLMEPLPRTADSHEPARC